jgi:protein-arginine kinase activator protein McsA
MNEILCDGCGAGEATLHWTEIIAGSVLERHLCERCRSEEMPFDFPSESELRFHCRCGKTVHWRIPRGVCEHGASAYERTGRAEVEISTCECGIKFLAVASRWSCHVCGAEAYVQPHESGARGYVYDHIYGSPDGEEIQIRGIMP